MKQSDIPSRFNKPFANSASASYIRAIPDAHVAASGSDAPASLDDGFPPETFLAIGSGGIPPNGKDFNGLFNRITGWSRWQAAGSPAVFNTAFCTAIGGYPRGAKLDSTSLPGVVWISLADDNTTDPDGSSPANWSALAQTLAGQIAHFALPNAPVGWLKANGAAVSRTTYAGLFAVIGIGFGPGNGTTTFNLPELRGEFIRSLDDGRGVDTGRVLGTLQGGMIEGHSHNGTTGVAGAHQHDTPLNRDRGYNVANVNAVYGDENFDGVDNKPSTVAGDHSHSFTTNATGGSETRPRNMALLACIRT